MTTIFTAKVLNPYRSHVPRGFYNLIKGHLGVDLNYVNEELRSPITGLVVAVTHQTEMGICVYIKDVHMNTHVFAHCSKVMVNLHDKVKRGDVIAITGNTGSKTTAPHLHYEIITLKPVNKIDYIMSRNLMGFKGYNTDPLDYIRALYKEFNVPIV